MNITVQQLIVDTMGLIGATAIDETPSSSELQVGLRTANMMINSWATNRLLLRSEIDITFNLTTNKAAYTIGLTGADITENKILAIKSGYVTDASIDHPVEIIEKGLYDSFEDKNVSKTRPEYVAFDAGIAQQTNQTGTIYFYNTPDKTYPVTLSCTTVLNEFVNLSDLITFEPVYIEALMYNLAIRLYRRYHDRNSQIPMDIVDLAQKSMTNLKALNSFTVLSGTDLPGKVNVYNVYTDGY